MATETTEPADDDDFELPAPDVHGAAVTDPDQLVLNLEGFEGPLDLLLLLARSQKVDLTQISILALVEQYLAFIGAARKLRIELAADYLVMAAWLAYLKSRLLLPREADDDEPSGEEMAARLQLQLQRLEAMREAGARLMSRERLGRDIFARGAPEPVRTDRHAVYDVTLYELLKVYGEGYARSTVKELHIAHRRVFSLEDAIHRLSRLIGETITWTRLQDFLPGLDPDPAFRKSELASMFVAGLELARTGKADLRQLETYGPIYIKRQDTGGEDDRGEAVQDGGGELDGS